ncbi:MAG: DUF4326 domain-containing protein [Chloroflexi bacterium]|nr:DUF4326 domain-containing protein [Chloroflexota bacterium]
MQSEAACGFHLGFGLVILRGAKNLAPSRGARILPYRQYRLSRPDLLTALPELRGKTLSCWCKPKPCHGDVLVDLADGAGDE